jgi:hypothetical protein
MAIVDAATPLWVLISGLPCRRVKTAKYPELLPDSSR